MWLSTTGRSTDGQLGRNSYGELRSRSIISISFFLKTPLVIVRKTGRLQGFLHSSIIVVVIIIIMTLVVVILAYYERSLVTHPPSQVLLNDTAVQLSCGSLHNCAVMKSNEVVCWGTNSIFLCA
jgi:alpha-tubulin suppressor-like RCC1 family protein